MKNFSATFLRVLLFSVIWCVLIRILIYIQYHYIFDVGAPYLLFFSAIQFPIIFIIYLYFDSKYKNSDFFINRKWLLVPVGILIAVILYAPLLFLTIQIPRLIIR